MRLELGLGLGLGLGLESGWGWGWGLGLEACLVPGLPRAALCGCHGRQMCMLGWLCCTRHPNLPVVVAAR